MNAEEYNEPQSVPTGEDVKYKQVYKIEGVICLWKADAEGNLQKRDEKSFSTGWRFKFSTNGNMTMNITNDKKVLTLTYFKAGDEEDQKADKEEDEKHEEDHNASSEEEKTNILFRVMAWEIDT